MKKSQRIMTMIAFIGAKVVNNNALHGMRAKFMIKH